MQATSFIVIRGNSMRLDGGSMFGNALEPCGKNGSIQMKTA